MGCDIHLYVEVKNNGNWELVEGENPWIAEYKDWYNNADDEIRKSYLLERIQEMEKNEPRVYEGWLYNDRNYRLFALLADVRNGIDSYFNEPATGHQVNPISKPKGMPNDLSDLMQSEYDNYYEHSGNYLTLKELLNYDWNQKVKFRYLVSPEEYKSFKINGRPGGWCGGSNAILITNEQMDEYLEGKIKFERDFIHTVVEWELPVKDCVGRFYTECIEQLKLLGNPEDVRLVFWFDS